MSELKGKLFEYFSSLSTAKKLIWVIGILILLVIFYLFFIKNNYRGSDINYNDINAQKIIEYSSEVYDRDELLSVNLVIENILKIYENKWVLNNKPITLKNLYDNATTENYKKSISRSKFEKKIEEIYSKIFDVNEKYNSSKNYIEKVYHSDTYDMYLIKLKSFNNSEAYIGIKIDGESYLIKYAE